MAGVKYINKRFQSEQPDSREVDSTEPHVPQSTCKLAAEQRLGGTGDASMTERL
jgi:hypothetical protein